jgi:hypothetical protein
MFPFPRHSNGMSRKEYLKQHPRTWTKHSASKRGYQHKHRPSRGQRNHLAFLRGG